MGCPDARSIPETAGHDDQPLQSSIGGRQFGCSGANADAVELWPRYWAHSRIARRSRRRKPGGILVHPLVPQINVPPVSMYRLAAHATKTWTLSVCAFAIGRRRYPECCWQSAFAVLAKPPGPAVWCPAVGSERAGQTISANWIAPASRNQLQAGVSAARTDARAPETERSMERCPAMPS